MTTLDTLAIARTLTDAGADPKLAAAITAAVREAARPRRPRDARPVQGRALVVARAATARLNLAGSCGPPAGALRGNEYNWWRWP